MEEEDNIIVKWAQEDVETSYNLLNNNNNNNNNNNIYSALVDVCKLIKISYLLYYNLKDICTDTD